MTSQGFIRICTAFLFFVALIILIRSVYLTISTFAPDFSVMWTGTRSLLLNRNPYTDPKLFTGIGYPPDSLLFYIPLTLSPYGIAQGIFVLLSAFSILGIILLLFKIINGNKRIKWVDILLVFSLVAFSFPTKFTLGMGQNNLLVFLLLLFLYYLYKTKREVGSGIILGLSISFKPIFIFFLLFFLLKKQWKILITSVLTIIFVILATTAIFGGYLYIYYIKQVIPLLLDFSGREIYYNQGFMGFISRLTTSLVLRSNINIALSLSAILSVIWLTYSKIENRKLDNLQLSLFIIILLLVDTRSWQHHFVWLVFPFVVIFEELRRIKLKALYPALVLAYFLVSWNFKNPTKFMEFPVSLILSNTFYGALLLFVLNSYLIIRSDPKKLRLFG